jgi:hypothetical protein
VFVCGAVFVGAPGSRMFTVTAKKGRLCVKRFKSGERAFY